MAGDADPGIPKRLSPVANRGRSEQHDCRFESARSREFQLAEAGRGARNRKPPLVGRYARDRRIAEETCARR
jgi:hypothetical protein